MKIRPGSEQVFIEAYGTVIPSRQITLSAQVNGKVIQFSADTDLSEFDLQEIAGLARDPATGHYLIIDPSSDQLVRIVR